MRCVVLRRVEGKGFGALEYTVQKQDHREQGVRKKGEVQATILSVRYSWDSPVVPQDYGLRMYSSQSMSRYSVPFDVLV